MSATAALPFFAIDDHALLLIKGPDAFSFLQGQVTCDVDALAVNGTVDGTVSQSALGAHCTHKGRMRFSFRALALDTETIALSIYRPLLPDALAGLKKYSVFSKVELIDASEQFELVGFQGQDLASLFSDVPATVNQATHKDTGVLIRVSDNRYEAWLNTEQAATLKSQLTSTGTSSEWTLGNIRDGIGEVRPETLEEFIPQMLNLDSMGDGISFNKGCYTGQEVVARMAYLGKLKRRMYRFACSAEANLAPGDALYRKGSSQSIGKVVLAETAGSQLELLAVATTDAVAEDNIYASSDYTHKLEALSLPYAITKE